MISVIHCFIHCKYQVFIVEKILPVSILMCVYICMCAMLHLSIYVLLCVCISLYKILLSSFNCAALLCAVSIVRVVENCPLCITSCINKVVVCDATQINLLP